jgi:acetyl-CoA synthetase
MNQEILPVYEANTQTAFSLYKERYAESIKDTSKYWGDVARSKVDWFLPFTTVQSGGFADGDVAWFLNGKLNVCYNAVDRWCLYHNRGNDVAIIWEGDEPDNVRKITFAELFKKVCQIANALKAQGVRKGDVVTIYMPMIPEIAMTMLACCRIGAIHSVVFGGFSSDAIAERIVASSCKWVVTTDGGKRGGKYLPLKQVCDIALAKECCKAVVQTVFVFNHHNDGTVQMVPGRDVAFDELIMTQRPYCPCEVMDSEDNLFILYTSGSTGRPVSDYHL